jgi:predicted TIM-barrel fold metal-dependent hydrolase
VATGALGQFLTRFPEHHVLFAGIYKPEVEKLALDHTNFSAEISFCEWANTLEALVQKIPARRLMLGTCTPLLSTRGEVEKLVRAFVPAKTKALIGSENARRLFNL